MLLFGKTSCPWIFLPYLVKNLGRFMILTIFVLLVEIWKGLYCLHSPPRKKSPCMFGSFKKVNNISSFCLGACLDFSGSEWIERAIYPPPPPETHKDRKQTKESVHDIVISRSDLYYCSWGCSNNDIYCDKTELGMGSITPCLREARTYKRHVSITRRP